MSSKNVETFRTAHQAFNRREFDLVASMLSEQFTYEDRARGTTFKGRQGFKEFMQAWATAFSNASVTEPVYIDGGDVVVATFIGTGTNDGPFGTLLPTRKAMTLRFCEMMRFNPAGQIVSGEIYYDQLSLLSQLGVAAAAVAQ